MHRLRSAAIGALILVSLAFASPAGATKLLRFPDVWHDRIVFSYAGDLWTVGTEGGVAVRLTSSPGLELFAKFSPDGRSIAFTGQYGGDEQVYVIPAGGGAPRQLTFYPAVGPLPDRWGYDNQVYGWTPDGAAVLFRSARDGYLPTDSRLYTAPLRGGAPTALPMPVSGAGDFSPDGGKIVYSPRWRDFRSEKRYQGGWANDLYIFDLVHPSLLRVTSDPRTDRDPMWVGAAIYFNSDRTGVFNLYRYDIETRETRALTHYTDWDVRWPSAGPEGQIVYELGGELHIYDTRSDQDRALSISVPADTTAARPQAVNAADNIEGFTLSPGGERVAMAARGDIFSIPVEHGVSRNLTHSSSAHDREVAWSADGRRLAYVSDRSGEEEIYVQSQDGAGDAAQLTSGSLVRYYAPRWSGDDRRLAYADSTGRLHVIELATGRHITVARDPADLSHDYRWSPDGRYLGYTQNGADGFSGVFVWSAEDEKSRRVTPEGFNSHSPSWAPNGDLLYFLSERDYQPILSTIEFEFATYAQTGIFAVTLRKDVRNPFGIRDDETGDGDAPAHEPIRKGAARIDFAGIEQRTIRVPLEAGNLTNLSVGTENLLYQRSGPYVYGRESNAKGSVMAYSIKEREAEAVAEDVLAWSATSDGKHVLARLSTQEFKYFDVDDSDDAHNVSLAGLATTRVPAAEWREIFAEAWRRYRDYFYVDNMHGYDWPKLREKYAPLLDDVGSRADLNYVVAEMIAELTVQHAYIEGGDLGLPKRPFVALPGARFELDAKAGRYRIGKIFAGQNEEEPYRSPLTEVGVNAHEGDYVLAINGRELKAGTDPYELLQAPADQPVEWRLSAGADGREARTIRYRPLASEANLRYLARVAENRARVDRLSAGRLGYIHLPDMQVSGIREFIKGWYPQVRKEGLVIDVRDNGGGNISQLLIARLARTLHGTSFVRNHSWVGTYPRVVQPGPKVALINERTASDGEIFANAFRQWKIGALIGDRTWGGVVGTDDHGPLLDGGAVFVPEFGTADENGRWIIEGHGVDPDIEVAEDPVEVLQGRDPQLERAVLELMKLLPAAPAGLPQPPAPPVKTGTR
jgi:tricorn protease